MHLQVLPASMGGVHYEPGCDGRILSTLLNPAVVQRVETLPQDWDADTLIAQVAAGDFHALIDAGALIVGISNEEVARRVLRRLPRAPFAGVVFLSDADECLVLLRDERLVPLQGCGLAPEERFTFYDHVHTTGLDVPQALSARAALTLGKDTMWRDYAQAAFRMRSLGPQTQTLSLFVPPAVRHLISEAAHYYYYWYYYYYYC